jgi:gamma-glutamyltranspeptidase/glutathione hydrolase
VLLIRFPDGRARVTDGHSYAPAAASLATIDEGQQRRGRTASTIPSTVATLHHAHSRYGRLPRDVVMRPAIAIAEGGYRLTALQRRQIAWVAGELRGSAAGDIFLVRGETPPVDHLLCQPALAGTLRRIAAVTPQDFYRGTIADMISEDMERHGGLITKEDLADRGEPPERNAISGTYRGHTITTTPEPSGGPQLLLALQILERIAPEGFAKPDSQWREAVALATSAAYHERERLSQLPIDRYQLEPDRSKADLIAKRPLSRGEEHGAEAAGDTTHLSVSDHHGCVVMLTQSIQSVFGAKIAHPALGFIYNNYLSTCPRKPHLHGLMPRCRPRSNAAPTLVLRRDQPIPLLALGSAGSRRILSSILQVISAVIDHHWDIGAAVAAPRVHGLLSSRVWLERPAVSDDLIARLRARGRHPVIKPALAFAMGAVHALEFPSDAPARAAADPRRDGTAIVLK